MTQAETVIAGDSRRLGCKAGFVKDGVHEVAGSVSGEGAAGSIGSMGSRSQAKDEDAGTGITKAWNRAGPVGLIAVGAAFGLTDTLAIVAKAETAFAGGDGLMNLKQGRREGFCRTCHWTHHSG